MVVVGRKKHIGIRVIGDYRWEKSNGWEVNVRDSDVLEILTNPGFTVVGDDLAAIDGITDSIAEELLLRGITTFEQLSVAKPSGLAKDWGGVGIKTVRGWQSAAIEIIQKMEEEHV